MAEENEDISTDVAVEAAKEAPLLVPPSKDTIIITDEDHSDEISDDAFSDPRNGAPLQLPPAPEDQALTLNQLFGTEEASLSDSGDDPRSEITNEAEIIEISNDEEEPEEQAVTLGLKYLSDKDAALAALTTEHAISAPAYDTRTMTTFQRVTRPLLETICIPEKKATIYEALEKLCQPDVVRPYSVGTNSYEQLMNIGVATGAGATKILHLCKIFEESGTDKMNTLLSDDVSDQNLFHQLRHDAMLRPYMAFTVLLFGFERLNFWPTHEMEFEEKYDAFNKRLRRWSWSPETLAALESWEPYKGLAAWIIWTHA